MVLAFWKSALVLVIVVCELDDVDDVVSLLTCPTQLAIVTKEATHKTNNP